MVFKIHIELKYPVSVPHNLNTVSTMIFICSLILTQFLHDLTIVRFIRSTWTTHDFNVVCFMIFNLFAL